MLKLLHQLKRLIVYVKKGHCKMSRIFLYRLKKKVLICKGCKIITIKNNLKIKCLEFGYLVKSSFMHVEP